MHRPRCKGKDGAPRLPRPPPQPLLGEHAADRRSPLTRPSCALGPRCPRGSDLGSGGRRTPSVCLSLPASAHSIF